MRSRRLRGLILMLPILLLALAAAVDWPGAGGTFASDGWTPPREAPDGLTPYFDMDDGDTCGAANGWTMGMTGCGTPGGSSCDWTASVPGQDDLATGTCSENTPSNDAWCQAMSRIFSRVCPRPQGEPVPQHPGTTGGHDGENEGSPPCMPGGCQNGNMPNGGNLRAAPNAPTSAAATLRWRLPARWTPARAR